MPVDESLPERERYLVAMSAAVQLSGLAERIGMAQSTQVVQTKMLDYFFSLRKLHAIAFQPIVTLETGRPVRIRVPLPAADADAPAVDHLGRQRGDQHGSWRRARRLHRVERPRSGRQDRGRQPRGRPAAAPLRDQPDPGQPARPGLRAGRPRDPGPGRGPRPAPDHHRVHRAAVGLRHRRAPASGPRPAPDRLRVRGRRRGRRLRELRAHRGPQALGHQDRPGRGPRPQPRRRQAGPRRGLRVVRPPDRGAPPRRGHRAPRRPRRPDLARRRTRPGLPPRPARLRAEAPRRPATLVSSKRTVAKKAAEVRRRQRRRARVPSRA